MLDYKTLYENLLALVHAHLADTTKLETKVDDVEQEAETEQESETEQEETKLEENEDELLGGDDE